jgi:hypothetical protein
MIYFLLLGSHNGIEAVVTRLEKGSGQRPILVKFITFSKKFEVLANTIKSVATRIMIKLYMGSKAGSKKVSAIYKRDQEVEVRSRHVQE